jgi:hypothetical protein
VAKKGFYGLGLDEVVCLHSPLDPILPYPSELRGIARGTKKNHGWHCNRMFVAA